MESVKSLKTQIETLKQEIAQLKQDRSAVRIAHEKQADYAETQVRFRTVFESSRLGNKIISADLKIIQLNQALVSMLGYHEKDDIIGTRVLDYAPVEFHAHWLLLQENLWAKKIPYFKLESCLRRKDGSIFWCQVTSILFEDQKETLGYTILEDISVQHQLKQERENIISIASHELKTPLTSLQASLQIMHRIIERETLKSDKLMKLSLNATQSVARLGALVNDLLDSTRISKGKLNLKISRFKIADLVANTCSDIQTEGKYKLHYQGDPQLEISADQQKLDQVLVNLVNNAIKYAPESREIIIEAVELKDAVKISVIDQGQGIPKNKLSQLFDSYYQVQTAESNTRGLGLGLYISAEIIKRHDGMIGVESEIGKGSTFWFTIPKR